MQIKFTLDEGAYAPEKAHAADAGYDLRARNDATIVDCCNDGTAFDTGVHIAIPEGYVGFVQSKSGLNVKHGIICPVGTIDSGYTGSIVVKLYNLADDLYHVHAGDKIAQLIIQPIADTELQLVSELSDTDRGNNGFGSTGR